MFSLTTHHLEFSATVHTPLVLDAQAGAAIRGALVGGLWGRFCTNKAALTCAACPLSGVCPVAMLVAPMREDGEGGGVQRPRPYVIRPPQRRTFSYQPGDALSFSIGLIGKAAMLFPYLFMAAQEIESSGLGRRSFTQSGQRGQLQIDTIAAVHPLTNDTQPLYQRGETLVHGPGLPVTQEDVARYAATLSSERLTLHFHTPLRLTEKRDGETRLVHQFDPVPFFLRLAWRLDELSRDYGSGEAISHYQMLPELAARLRVVNDQTRWVDVVSHSSRTRQRTPIGGLVGQLTLEGPLSELRELLVWGSIIHVGKNAVKGDGWYTIGAADAT